MLRDWLIADPITPQAEANLHAYDPVLRQLLFNRGIGDAEKAASFLAGQPGFDTDPLQMTGMMDAVKRIARAIGEHETIAVYGDYDVDGVTATALLIQDLEALGAVARPYIPNRFDEGYGLNLEALDLLLAEGIRLVITVDCGIRSPAEAKHALDIGLDLIITDHHHPADGALPPALAIVNPKQPGDQYPEKHLAGVGIAYKLAQALAAHVSGSQVPESQLDLVALGTVADLAPLLGENRSLVRRGLAAIRNTQRQGLYSLAQVAGLKIQRTTASNIGFLLGPRLNAAGRLKSAEAALELLLTKDPLRAGALAQELEASNQERQTVTRETQ
ncbi:MAG TPA: DHH family phosphoesterase, partial [Anaerolineales bacterium]|nr:DHH family phosphoesterase [Anaerolineales bacterium]